MGKVAVVTGAGSGIGKATLAALGARGFRCIGVDLAGSDIAADLATAAGRREMIDAVERLAPDGVDAVVAAAGVAPPVEARSIAAVNFFGAVATLEGLRPLLARSSAPRAVAISSTSIMLGFDEALLEKLLAEDEDTAIASLPTDPSLVYPTTKQAIAQWVRRRATSADWAGAGVLLNAVAPGVTITPMTDHVRNSQEGQELLATRQPNALGRFARPEELAEVIAMLCALEGGYMLGQVIFVDGGIDAILRTDQV